MGTVGVEGDGSGRVWEWELGVGVMGVGRDGSDGSWEGMSDGN